ncbi:MAG: hypothetical protein OJF50_000453 [Nitrospira sp.]|nr:hypothetical protein [Nitrospira sp.]
MKNLPIISIFLSESNTASLALSKFLFVMTDVFSPENDSTLERE